MDGIYNNHCSALKPRGGCLIPDEQLNAWIHINVQKLCSQVIPKFPYSDIERDPRVCSSCMCSLLFFKVGIFYIELKVVKHDNLGKLVVLL